MSIKKSKTLAELREETKSSHVFSDFHVGDRVRVCIRFSDSDHSIFDNEVGTIRSLEDSYLGIRINFDRGTKLPPYLSFNPEYLEFVETKSSDGVTTKMTYDEAIYQYLTLVNRCEYRHDPHIAEDSKAHFDAISVLREHTLDPDLVKVVRCKDCLFFAEGTYFGVCNKTKIVTSLECYCSPGRIKSVDK